MNIEELNSKIINSMMINNLKQRETNTIVFRVNNDLLNDIKEHRRYFGQTSLFTCFRSFIKTKKFLRKK